MDVLDGLGPSAEDRARGPGRLPQADHRVIRRQVAKRTHFRPRPKTRLLGKKHIFY